MSAGKDRPKSCVFTHLVDRVKRHFELITIDVLVLLRTRSGSVVCLVAVDHCSKWVAVRPLRDKSAGGVKEAFDKFILPNFARVPVKVFID